MAQPPEEHDAERRALEEELAALEDEGATDDSEIDASELDPPADGDLNSAADLEAAEDLGSQSAVEPDPMAVPMPSPPPSRSQQPPAEMPIVRGPHLRDRKPGGVRDLLFRKGQDRARAVKLRSPDSPTPVSPPALRPDGATYLLPIEPDGESDAPRDPVDEIFPPELRAPRHAPGASSPMEPGGPREAMTNEPLHVAPRVLVVVSLAESNTKFLEAAHQAAEELSPHFRGVAKEEIEWALWVRDCQRGAGDPPLPH